MAQNLAFDEGFKEYTINGDENRVIRVNTSDYGLVTRFQDARRHIEQMITKYEKFNLKPDGSPADESDEEATDALKEMGDFIRSEIDYIFGAKIADIVFGTTHPMSTVKGLPLYERFLNSVMPIINADLEAERKKSEAVIKKYQKQAQRFANSRK